MTQRQRRFDDPLHSGPNLGGESSSAMEPTWFLHPANQQSREDLVARYRQSRNFPETPYRESSVSSAMRPEYREFISARPRPPARFLLDDSALEPEKPGTDVSKSRREIGLKQTFALAALVAVVSGGTGGFLNSQFGAIMSGAYALVAGGPAPVTATAQPSPRKLHTVAATVIAKKPVATATLRVSDASGQTNSLIPLLLHAEPAVADQDIFLKISGLPDTAYLTTGRKDADKVWALTIDDLKDLKLMIPASREKQIDLAVAAFEKRTGELAAPVKTLTIALSSAVVQPAAAPPPGQMQPALPIVPQEGHMAAIPVPSSVSFAVLDTHRLANPHATAGDDLLGKGDLNGARHSYQRAWNSGSPDGAFGLARSYDPVVLASLKVKSANADRGKALEWYARAAAAGKSGALGAMVRLRMKP